MFRKIVFASIVVVLILSNSISPSLAQGTNSNEPDHHRTTFEVAFNPGDYGIDGWGVFWITPVSFKNRLYDFVSEGLFTGDTPLKVFSSKDGKKWEFAGNPLPDQPEYNFVEQGFVYHNDLYIALDRDRCLDPSIKTPGLVMRTSNGRDWEQVFQAPEVKGLTNETQRFGEFKGMLYLATIVGAGQTGAAQLYRSRSGDPGTWDLVSPEFGNNTTSLSTLAVLGRTAFMTSGDANGLHIWRSTDGVNWNEVGQDVLNDPAYTNYALTDPVVFSDAVYVGTNNFFFMAGDPNLYTGGQLYRSTDGTHWQLVVEKGFGNPIPSGIDSLVVYHGQLYALSNTMPPDIAWNITYVWRSHTGNPGDWVNVNPDGMGSGTLVVTSYQTIFKDDLYIGNQGGWYYLVDVIKMVNP